MKKLDKKRVAILATDGFEYSELVEPRKALLTTGVIVDVIAPKAGAIKGWSDGNWSMNPVHVNKTLAEAESTDYVGLVLPGGVINLDSLRVNEAALSFVRQFFAQGKPVAAICHGPWILINAGVVEGRRMTSFDSIRQDLENAGAIWEDCSVVVDNGLVTSRNPSDLPDFNEKIVEEIAKGVYEGQLV